jgi:hypothetical protein
MGFIGILWDFWDLFMRFIVYQNYKEDSKNEFPNESKNKTHTIIVIYTTNAKNKSIFSTTTTIHGFYEYFQFFRW